MNSEIKFSVEKESETFSIAQNLLSRVYEITSYEEVAQWDDEAQTTISLLNQIIAIRENDISELFVEIEATKKRISALTWWKKLFTSDNKLLNTQRHTIKKIESLKEKSEQFISELDDWIAKTPDNPEQSKLLVQELKRIKKELLQKKKEAQAQIRQIGVSARQELTSINSQFFSNSKYKQIQRAGLREQKEKMLSPHESFKTSLEEGIIKIEKLIVWIERINTSAPTNYTTKPSVKSETISEPAFKRKTIVRKQEQNENEETLEEILKELNSFIGLENIKNDIISLINYLKVQQSRAKSGLPTTQLSLHSVFLGPPGTGKTSIARIIGRLYKALGFLDKGHTVEADRSSLVGGYLGQTALKVDEIVKNALDGVLFIDEAYALSANNDNDSYGKEAIDTLLKRMEDYRERIVIIVAGYTKEMSNFLESNPGLKSRFNKTFIFHNYKSEELLAILKKYINENGYELDSIAEPKVGVIIDSALNSSDHTFGNARFIRNLFEKIIQNQANRISILSNPSKNELVLIKEEDVHY